MVDQPGIPRVPIVPLLLFPVLWRAGPAAKAGLGGLLLVALGWLAYRTGDYFNQWNGTYAILRCLPEFLAGMLLYSGYQSGIFASLLATDAVFAAVALLLATLLHLGAPDLAIIPLFPLLILAAVRNTGRFSPLLNSPPLAWLGDISYSLYLLHWFVLFVTIEIVRRLPALDFANLPLAPSLTLIAVLIAVSLALATPSFRFIEVTGRRWLRQRLDVGRPAAGIGIASLRLTDGDQERQPNQDYFPVTGGLKPW